MCSCVWKCVKCAFKGSGCPLLFILMYVILDPLIVGFLDWFSCTVKVAIYLFSTCRSIFPGTCNAHSNVVFPSFHPLLFAVCCLQSGCVCRCIGQSRVPGMRLGILSQWIVMESVGLTFLLRLWLQGNIRRSGRSTVERGVAVWGVNRWYVRFKVVTRWS